MRPLLLVALALSLAACAPEPQVPANNGEYPLPPGRDDGAAAAQPDDLSWPQRIVDAEDSVQLYPPHATAWAGDRFSGRLPAEIDRKDSGKSYGYVFIEASTKTDPVRKVATLTDVHVTGAHFPAEATDDASWLTFLQEHAKLDGRELATDRINADLASANRPPLVVKNDAPRIMFVPAPEVLVLVDGDPVVRSENGVSRVINTRTPLFSDGGGFIAWVGDRWFRGQTIEGEYQPVTDARPELETAKNALVQDGKGDPGTEAAKKTSAGAHVIVATKPTEIIETTGPATYDAVPGTTLDYLTNTQADVFRDKTTSAFYVLVAGRWYRAASTSGPWTFVPPHELPATFASIPADHAKADVRANVPGTVEAEEALIASEIPITAAVDRAHAMLAVGFDGDPQFDPVQGADGNLRYATNSDTPVVQSAQQYYALSDGVWFVASSPNGPWAVATSVPESVYSIPPSSPIYYTTYVRVYDVTPDYVYFGYTPGYYGAYYSDGVVVWGTGYRYRPWIGGVWYGRPVTWGYGVGFGFGPGIGFAYGGWGRPWWGPGRYYGFEHGRGYGAYGGYGGYRGGAPNAYSHWGGAARPSGYAAGRTSASPRVGGQTMGGGQVAGRTGASPRVGSQGQSAQSVTRGGAAIRPGGAVNTRPGQVTQQRATAPQQHMSAAPRPASRMPRSTTTRRRGR